MQSPASRPNGVDDSLRTARLFGMPHGSMILQPSWPLCVRTPHDHAYRAVFPMALGFALVPRCRGGSVMGSSALATTMLLGLGGVPLPGVGALASLW